MPITSLQYHFIVRFYNARFRIVTCNTSTIGLLAISNTHFGVSTQTLFLNRIYATSTLVLGEVRPRERKVLEYTTTRRWRILTNDGDPNLRVSPMYHMTAYREFSKVKTFQHLHSEIVIELQ